MRKWKVTIYDQRALESYEGIARTRKQAFHRAELRVALAGLQPYLAAREMFMQLMYDHTRRTERAGMTDHSAGLHVCYERHQ